MSTNAEAGDRRDCSIFPGNRKRLTVDPGRLIPGPFAPPNPRLHRLTCVPNAPAINLLPECGIRTPKSPGFRDILCGWPSIRVAWLSGHSPRTRPPIPTCAGNGFGVRITRYESWLKRGAIDANGPIARRPGSIVSLLAFSGDLDKYRRSPGSPSGGIKIGIKRGLVRNVQKPAQATREREGWRQNKASLSTADHVGSSRNIEEPWRPQESAPRTHSRRKAGLSGRASDMREKESLLARAIPESGGPGRMPVDLGHVGYRETPATSGFGLPSLSRRERGRDPHRAIRRCAKVGDEEARAGRMGHPNGQSISICGGISSNRGDRRLRRPRISGGERARLIGGGDPRESRRKRGDIRPNGPRIRRRGPSAIRSGCVPRIRRFRFPGDFDSRCVCFGRPQKRFASLSFAVRAW